MFSFKDKVVLITGGTKGIGLSIVKQFLSYGAKIILTGRSKKIDNILIKEDFECSIDYIQVDFSNRNSMREFLTFIENTNRIDVCINNAGTNINNPIENIKSDDYNYLMDVNLKAPFRITQIVSQKMKQNSYGRIVNIASIWSVLAKANRTAYSITKHGILGLTKTSAVELAPYNVLVNAVSPGFTLTKLTKKTLKEDGIIEVSEIIPMKRLADPDEISKIVLFLASDLNTYITGQNILVDGGFSIV